jgi:2-keto-4-pentenoate hydratase/2-oxohepta-3-ene-1,7-dioic acid hydratase in catechol pathway
MAAKCRRGYRATNQGFFLKPSSSVSGPNDPVILPHVPGREVHHEAELGIIIGKTCRSVPRENWREAVFGYACLMDMVVRGREERVFRKAYDTFCPVGPWITTADEVPDPDQLEMNLGSMTSCASMPIRAIWCSIFPA